MRTRVSRKSCARALPQTDCGYAPRLREDSDGSPEFSGRAHCALMFWRGTQSPSDAAAAHAADSGAHSGRAHAGRVPPGLPLQLPITQEDWTVLRASNTLDGGAGAVDPEAHVQQEDWTVLLTMESS